MATQAEVEREEEVRKLVHELYALAELCSYDNVLVGGVQAMVCALILMSERGEYHQLYWTVQAFLLGHQQALRGNHIYYIDFFEKILILKEKLY